MKKRSSTLILIFFFLIGLSLLLYPTISNYWNQYHQSQAVGGYDATVEHMSKEERERLWAEAEAYNAESANKKAPFERTQKQLETYESVLNINGDGMMGYIEIPSIKVNLPIYHGTEDSALQVAVGHMDWSSMPVGGESTHCVLSGHRGLPSAKLFTDLDKLVVGDIFVLQVLDQTLTYEVDQILTVEPTDTASLQVVKGEDLCTLVTCTPYGVNSHRLLVRGHRTENRSTIRVTADAVQIEPVIVAPLVAIPLLILFTVWLILSDRKSRQRNSRRGDFNEKA